MTNELLIEQAKKALINAYAPYSKFNVGAAVIAESGKIYTGCNIENISYGGTICAERVAIFKAISEGEIKFTKIAIVSNSKEEKFSKFAGGLTFPCGICRQIMSEFMIDGEVILQDFDGTIKVYLVKELLPYSFS